MKIDNKKLEKIFFDISRDKTNGIEELYNNYKKMIYCIAFSILKNQEDSEDIMQIIFTKIYEMDNSKLPTSNYASWLYSITKNETINFLKKKNDIPLDKIYEITNVNDELNKVIDKIEFNKLISKLDEKEQEIISLKILSNFSFEEISKLLKKPVGTVKWRYYKSIYSLRILLGNLAMFIVSFTIGIKTLFANKQIGNISRQEANEQSSEEIENITNLTIIDDNNFQDESKGYNNENTQEESINQDIDTNNNTTTSIIQDINTTQENTIYEEQSISNYNHYVGYSFLCISIIFLIISLYFLIKYQLKHLKKLSK